jgi:hypothetical protein
MIAEQEQIERRAVVQSALASQFIVGLSLMQQSLKTPKNGRAGK